MDCLSRGKVLHVLQTSTKARLHRCCRQMSCGEGELSFIPLQLPYSRRDSVITPCALTKRSTSKYTLPVKWLLFKFYSDKNYTYMRQKDEQPAFYTNQTVDNRNVSLNTWDEIGDMRFIVRTASYKESFHFHLLFGVRFLTLIAQPS